MSGRISYRPEIDGLRAIAVLGVLVFHLDNTWLPGGFLGVDVFFVVSGFLITSIIQKELQEGAFSIAHFWRRRFKRLFPAIAVMVSCVSFSGAFLLIEPERGDLLLQALATIFSFQNIWLWRTTGDYWSTAAENMPLLHAWSLSIEEQFYIAFPLLLLAIHRLGVRRRTAFSVLVSIFVVSLVLCLYTTNRNPIASFYLLPTRMWELVAGALLAHLSIQRPSVSRTALINSPTAGIGILLVISSFIVGKYNQNFPGLLATIPCAGTLLILQPWQRKGLVHRVLSQRILVYLGKASYSIYLWHWPVIVFSQYVSTERNIVVVLTTIAALAASSYHFIERPLRYARWKPQQVAFGLLAMFLLIFFPLLMFPSSPLVSELGNLQSPESFSRGREYEATAQIAEGGSGVYMSQVEESHDCDICVVGSSHARVMCEPIAEYARQQRYSALSMATSGIGITDRASTRRPNADEINHLRWQRIKELRPKVVIVAGRWDTEIQNDLFETALRGWLRHLSDHADMVIVVGQVPIPELPSRYHAALRKYLVARSISGATAHLQPSVAVQKANLAVANSVDSLGLENVFYVNTHSLFLDESESAVQVLQGGRMLYSNFSHVNDEGAGLIFDKLLHPLLSQRLSLFKRE